MRTGIILCGLNGAGKSTLGKALAEKLNFYFIDNEDLYFPKTDLDYLYASPRPREEVEELLRRELETHENIIFASVKGDYKIIETGLDAGSAPKWHIVLVEVPRDIRLQRVKDRSFRKFGERMLPGGDLYEEENRFFAFAQARAEDTVEKWVQAFGRPVIRVDGTRPAEENAELIAGQL